jgi:hypothetical protein
MLGLINLSRHAMRRVRFLFMATMGLVKRDIQGDEELEPSNNVAATENT